MITRKTGVAEWAEHSANLFVGCSNGCRYCYARERAVRFGQIKSPAEWATPRPLKHIKHYRRKVSGVIMFPTAHDITPENVPQCAAYLEEMLKPGNQVLIVTKPSLVCIEHLCTRLRHWREQIEFRFTIGCWSDKLARYWEPNAPSINQRLAALDHAASMSYRLSVSIEPMLDPANIVAHVYHLENPCWPLKSIWLGKMNNIRRRVQIVTEEDRRQVERIDAGQTDERIMEIVNALKDDPLIRFKDSIREVIERCGR